MGKVVKSGFFLFGRVNVNVGSTVVSLEGDGVSDPMPFRNYCLI